MCGSVLYTAEPGKICAYSRGGKLLFEQQTNLQDPVLKACGSTVLAYDPGKTTLYCLNHKACKAVEVLSGILTASPGPDGCFAVTTAGSGYYTAVLEYPADGSDPIRSGFVDCVVADLIYLDDGRLLMSCVSPDGAWSLRLSGAVIPLDPALVLDMAPQQNGFAVWTDEGVLFFDENGQITDSMPGEGIDWACGDRTALLLYDNCGFRLRIKGDNSSYSDTDRLPHRPLKLTVCEEYVCLLDRQCLLIYDEKGALRGNYPFGAGASKILTWANSLLLIGPERLLCHWIL
ncbi:MAG: hypothetical protein IJ206_01560 [Oscillospiraceae bacterium]|nr:hypothetical protein [Oscillospiraceae bacterium]